MAVENMVWAINAPVRHHPKLARKQTWVNTGGQTGIVGPASLEVRPLDVPGEGVQVVPGGFAIAATPGGSAGYASSPRESYAGDVEQTRTVTIRRTGSSGPRTDVLGIIINDPDVEGTLDQMTPGQIAEHRFWDFHVIENYTGSSNAPAAFGLSRPFLPLARITLPPNRADVRAEDITDIRFMAVRRTHTELYTYTPNRRRVMSGPGEFTEGVDREIPIPQWATRMIVHGDINGMALTGTPSTDVSGTARAMVVVGDGGNPANVSLLETTRLYELDQPRFNRITVPISGAWTIPESRRGQSLRLLWRFNLENRPGNLTIFEEGTRFDLTLYFEESPTGVNS